MSINKPRLFLSNPLTPTRPSKLSRQLRQGLGANPVQADSFSYCTIAPSLVEITAQDGLFTATLHELLQRQSFPIPELVSTLLWPLRDCCCAVLSRRPAATTLSSHRQSDGNSKISILTHTYYTHFVSP